MCRSVAACALMMLILTVSESGARIHQLKLKNETRFVVHLNTFGYFANGTLDVHLVSLTLPPMKGDSHLPVGFSLARSRVNGILSFTAEEMEECLLMKAKSEDELILFLIDTENHSVHVKHMGSSDLVLVSRLKLEKTTDEGKVRRKREEEVNGKPKDPSDGGTEKQKENSADQAKVTAPVTSTVSKPVESLNGKTLELEQHGESYNFSFRLIMSARSQGLYNLDFQNCNNMRQKTPSPYSLHVEITEKNPNGYLYSVFKIHWLMAALAYTKAVSLLFHSINYHFINSEGHPIEGWAVMYYITHLLKGALLFITLALIGTGFAFVKYILSDKEKKIFMIVIPLQVLANVSYIIIEETEEGASEYTLWREILFLVDLICCGAVLFPVVWSIRHLQEASNTDGKGVYVCVFEPKTWCVQRSR
ncbi:Protein GPR108 [Anabarilius grahami]|uniref:Protein GPR108 n=1 Tax=Anabarilius grahami TaxID=495550 RepID=A0A3N0Z8S0_ANAGA|nr:Protein GPR108 [Anabarilius grahami]